MSQDVVIFQPASPALHWKGPILLVLPLFVIVAMLSAEDTASRLMLLVFMALFCTLGALGIRYHRSRFAHPLRLDPTGISWPPFVRQYGVEQVPWSDIARIEQFHGTYAGASPGPRWLCLFVRDGEFRRRLRRPAGERIAGGDLNLLLAFEAEPDEVLAVVRQFHQRFG